MSQTSKIDGGILGSDLVLHEVMKCSKRNDKRSFGLRTWVVVWGRRGGVAVEEEESQSVEILALTEALRLWRLQFWQWRRQQDLCDR